MTYALSIDWLSFFCSSSKGELLDYITQSPNETFSWSYEKADHGTRQFKELVNVYKDDDLMFEVQQIPCSSILEPRSMIVKVANRYLYSAGLWFYIDTFFSQQNISILNISRIDICADFNCFSNNLHPIALIRGFLNSKYRHIGRGIGNAYFNHAARKEGKYSRSFLNYTGLSFGSNESAARAYLYNKSFELKTVKDKPYIRNLWSKCGLINNDEVNVWRLEVSIKSKGMNFKDKRTKQKVTICKEMMCENVNLSLIYFTFVKSLFSFVKNSPCITNISRVPRIELFQGEPYISRGVLPNESGGDRTERILIKQLWQMSMRYRGNELVEDEGVTKLLASNLASNTGLTDWLAKKSITWERPHKK